MKKCGLYFLLIALAAFIILPCEIIYAGENAPPETSDTHEIIPQPPDRISNELKDDPLPEKPRKMNWLDDLHAYVNNGVYDSAVWFDNFFSEDRSEEESLAGTFIRYRLDFILNEGESLDLKRRLHFDVKLPRAEDKLRLVFTSEKTDELSEIKARDIADSGYRQGSLKLRYNAVEKLLENFSINIGWIDLTLRYRYLHPFNETTSARFTQTGFWDNDDGFGGTTRLDLECWPKKTRLLRWSTSSKYAEETRGLEWASALTYFEQISPRNGLTFNIGLSGITEPESEIDNYNISCSFRRNFYRRWLFYEIRPEYNWPLQEDGIRDSLWRITLRFEIQFAHMEKI